MAVEVEVEVEVEVPVPEKEIRFKQERELRARIYSICRNIRYAYHECSHTRTRRYRRTNARANDCVLLIPTTSSPPKLMIVVVAAVAVPIALAEVARQLDVMTTVRLEIVPGAEAAPTKATMGTTVKAHSCFLREARPCC